MQINPSQLQPSMDTAERIIVALMRALKERHSKEWIQPSRGGERVDVVSLTEDTDADGITRMYGYFGFVVNTSLAVSASKEWEKILPLSDATVPPGFYKN